VPFTSLVAPGAIAWADLGVAEGPAEDALARSEFDATPLICGNGPGTILAEGCLLAARVGMIDSVMAKLLTTS